MFFMRWGNKLTAIISGAGYGLAYFGTKSRSNSDALRPTATAAATASTCWQHVRLLCIQLRVGGGGAREPHIVQHAACGAIRDTTPHTATAAPTTTATAAAITTPLCCDTAVSKETPTACLFPSRLLLSRPLGSLFASTVGCWRITSGNLRATPRTLDAPPWARRGGRRCGRGRGRRRQRPAGMETAQTGRSGPRSTAASSSGNTGGGGGFCIGTHPKQLDASRGGLTGTA